MSKHFQLIYLRFTVPWFDGIPFGNGSLKLRLNYKPKKNFVKSITKLTTMTDEEDKFWYGYEVYYDSPAPRSFMNIMNGTNNIRDYKKYRTIICNLFMRLKSVKEM